jgi:serine/threonine-protein kinase
VSEDPTQVEGKSPAADESAHPLVFAGRWRAIALLGTGGMGSVFLARDTELGELVALKTLRGALEIDRHMIERFRDEVRLARRVSSPYVARTHDLGEEEGHVFMTMQFVDGETLSARIKREGALPLADVVRLAHDIAAGLDAVHEAGIVHRDLKPSNVMITNDGRAILTDFGIALPASAGGHADRSGTPTYTAPEQILGGHVDRRADIFAFGGLLYAAATGHRPFSAKRTGHEAPPDPRDLSASLPEVFRQVVLRAMSLDPASRFATAGEIHEALSVLARPGARVRESALFDFVKTLSGRARLVGIGEIRCDPSRVALRDAVQSHLVEWLASSGELAASSRHDATTEAIIEGAIAEHEGDCVIDLELRSREGDAFWRQSFRGPLRSVAGITENGAAAIARALSASLSDDVTASFASSESAQRFLEARALIRHSWMSDGLRAIEMLDALASVEPSHPSVLAWRGVGTARLRFMRESQDSRAMIERAFALGGAREPDPHFALAQCHIQDMRAADTMRELLVAMRLAPGLVDARIMLASLMEEIGAAIPATRLASAALEGDPQAVDAIVMLMRIAMARRDAGEVEALARRIPSDSPVFARVTMGLFRAAVWLRAPRLAEGLKFPVMDGPTQRSHQVTLATLAGQRPVFEPFEALMVGVSPRRAALVAQIAVELAAHAGDNASFFAWLDRAVAASVFDVAWIDACPLFDPYRGTVHFETARRAIHGRAFEALAEAERVLAE